MLTTIDYLNTFHCNTCETEYASYFYRSLKKKMKKNKTNDKSPNYFHVISFNVQDSFPIWVQSLYQQCFHLCMISSAVSKEYQNSLVILLQTTIFSLASLFKRKTLLYVFWTNSMEQSKICPWKHKNLKVSHVQKNLPFLRNKDAAGKTQWKEMMEGGCWGIKMFINYLEGLDREIVNLNEAKSFWFIMKW